LIRHAIAEVNQFWLDFILGVGLDRHRYDGTIPFQCDGEFEFIH
jgi:hypothetical protein